MAVCRQLSRSLFRGARTIRYASGSVGGTVHPKDEAIYTEEHWEMRQSLNKLIERDINPHVEAWEEAQIFPARSVFKTLGDGGFLGPTKPTEYGGLGLDFSYSMAIAEELGNIKCGGVPMGIGVHTGQLLMCSLSNYVVVTYVF